MADQNEKGTLTTTMMEHFDALAIILEEIIAAQDDRAMGIFTEQQIELLGQVMPLIEEAEGFSHGK